LSVAIVGHAECAAHETGPGHPERPERVEAIRAALTAAPFAERLTWVEAPRATRAQLERVHDPAYVADVFRRAPTRGHLALDPDTVMGPHSLQAALRAAGALVHAVDLALGAGPRAAFCNVRPPGHHAERGRAMGFCIFDNVAVGAAHALEAHGLERVAIVDFDVHHGNGTEDVFREERRVLLCSSFQHPFYPFSGSRSGTERILNVPLAAGTDGPAFRRAVDEAWFDALDAFQPQLVLVSAGFDAHREDAMGNLALDESDYTWITRHVRRVADAHASGRVVSALEGGYALGALGRSAVAHVGALLGA
jgi:acetoin utilization deacetylase AcuC-like enzyme